MDKPSAYFWECEKGHRCAVSEVLMQDAIVKPRCTIVIRFSTLERCFAEFTKRLEPVPEGD